MGRKTKTNKQVIEEIRQIMTDWQMAQAATNGTAANNIEHYVDTIPEGFYLQKEGWQVLRALPGNWTALEKIEALVGLTPKTETENYERYMAWLKPKLKRIEPEV